MTSNLYEAAYQCIMCCDVNNKLELTSKYEKLWKSDDLGLHDNSAAVKIINPGRPVKPELVTPDKLPRRGMGTPQGRIILMHAIAHIEFNALNLAWDAVYRFRDLPREYYSDWIRVAREEARHFSMIRAWLEQHGSFYGEYAAHDGLWHMAIQTMDDSLIRMALIPRVFEARGLDVTPDMIKGLANHGAYEVAEILQQIYEDEIGHVHIGSSWFEFLCEQRKIKSDVTFQEILREYQPVFIKNKLNKPARRQAGFSDSELTMIENIT
ncbi:MAG: DUF455 domain-containing protein [Gammaproteobacteria bacterium]|nr:MAG: DUF455 domain-containing protein [Gammaproteobacteria bacterium]